MAVLFRQWYEVFDSTTVETSCTLLYDSPSIGALVRSTIDSANDTKDQATCNITNSGKLPAGNEGRFRFYVKTPATLTLTNNLTFFTMLNSLGHQILTFYLSSANLFSVFSQGTDLSSGGFNTSSTVTFAAATEYLLEGSYKANDHFQLWVNGVSKINNTGLGSATAGRATPTIVRVGVDHYDGADTNHQGPWLYRLFQLSDDNATALTDPVRRRTAAGVDSGFVHL